MKPWRQLDARPVPDGGDELQLWQRDTEFSIRLKRGGELMNSRAFGSERALATLVCPGLAEKKRPRVVVGGLGLGHTLAAALRDLPADARVVIAELSPDVVRWNRGPLGHLAGHPLDDPRVLVHVGDVGELLGIRSPATNPKTTTSATAASAAPSNGATRWDAVLLDVDNGPEGLTRDGNDQLYSARGLAMIAARLRPRGVLAVWSAHPSAAFRRRLQATGLHVEEHPVRARNKGRGKGARHFVWLAKR